MTTDAHEGLNGTPAGSFGLTQAFGNNADPGTALPYFRTTNTDWWSSDTSRPSTYNTHQICSKANCSFNTGASENLYQAGYVYGYAVVIDYNRFPVVNGKGSAFFLHVTNNSPTAGCVAIPGDSLARIMRWLDPAQHPRILMGVA
jgi:L,D-peptidoglycan transpeptidase YkuD (ErfK/YbiS/YcfS/YnhG family)